MLRKVLCMLVLLCIVASVVAPVFAARGSVDESLVIERVETHLDSNTLPYESELDSPEPIIINSVVIRNIPNASTVMSLVPIIAKSSSRLYRLYYRIDEVGTARPMTYITGTYAGATWDSTYSAVGWHTIYVLAKNILGKTVASTHVQVRVTRTYKYALYYEIDYMTGHYPPASVLAYWKKYWKAFAIRVTFKIDDVVADPTPSDGKITDADFWKLEKQYNDVWMYDDRAYGSSSSGKYTRKEKWMLYGTWAPSSTTGGYTYWGVRNSTDFIAGNYIFIADSMIDNWEAANAIPSDGGEEMVVLHEAGHSIGVGIRSNYNEVYDSDYYSVMGYMRLQNAKYIAPYWYYSKEEWKRVNLSYYRI